MTAIAGLTAHAGDSTATERRDLGVRLRAARPAGSVLLETCHRVELYGAADALAALHPTAAPPARVLDGAAVARHLVALAVGRASAVIGEDQVLHQLRDSVAEARTRGPLPPELDRILDRALRAGRRARSWLPARRPSLADLALDVAAARVPGGGRGRLLVVGAGRMGTLAARAAVARGFEVVLASRTPARAASVAAKLRVPAAPFVPVPSDIAGVGGVVVALSGEWPLGDAGAEALVGQGAWIADLSSPPAVPAALAGRLGERFVSIDDLARTSPATAPGLADRLDTLIDVTVAEHERWLREASRRSAARALAARAEDAREAELGALFADVGSLDPLEREAVARMAQRLTARLLRDPLERLGSDADGRHGRAARELFGL